MFPAISNGINGSVLIRKEAPMT